jgi:16S rRNA (cytosine967-C5)-methyltransferase
VRLSGGDPADLEPVRDGRAGVQDEGSQLAALVLARAPVTGSDVRWLDMCAGPGGKAALLAAVRPEGTCLVAADLQRHRARLVASAVAGGAEVVVADGTRPSWRADAFDRVLVDAPCSGLGALRRRPEVRWRRQPADVPRLQELQRHLLERAVDSCRAGGVVAYVTCSPHPAETAEVVRTILDGRRDVEPVDARPLLDGVPALGAGPAVQLWPHRHGTDAMFIALLRRVAVTGRASP